MRLLDEALPASGIFTLDVFRRGELVERFKDNNLIVTQGRTNLVKLLGGDVSGNSIARIGFGTSGAAASPGNTALSSPFIKDLDSHSYPTATSVLFNFSLTNSDAIGVSIYEFGLLTSSGLLHARKVRGGPLLKDSDLSLAGTWQLFY